MTVDLLAVRWLVNVERQLSSHEIRRANVRNGSI
jgi:hypothetical protein